jgi:hypothetical protein
MTIIIMVPYTRDVTAYQPVRNTIPPARGPNNENATPPRPCRCRLRLLCWHLRALTGERETTRVRAAGHPSIKRNGRGSSAVESEAGRSARRHVRYPNPERRKQIPYRGNLMVECSQPEERSALTREGRRPHFLTALLLKSGFAELLATNWPGVCEESGLPPVSSSLPERVS